MSTSASTRPGVAVFRSARNTARLVVGLPVFMAQHAVRLRSIRRIRRTVTVASWPLPPNVPATPQPDQQPRADGHGPITVRRYEVTVADPVVSAATVLEQFRNDPNAYMPHHVAAFLQGNEPAADLDVGDELVVELPSPWNGPVRVVRVTPETVRLVTLEGHMEAGHIEFACVEHGDRLTFSITSWARAGDRAFHVLHRVLGLAMEMQLAVWTTVCDRAALFAGGERIGDIEVWTETIERSDHASQANEAVTS